MRGQGRAAGSKPRLAMSRPGSTSREFPCCMACLVLLFVLMAVLAAVFNGRANGASCMDDATCQDVFRRTCTGSEGTFMGFNVTCADVVCPPIV